MRPPSLSHLLWLVSIVAAINPSLRHLCLYPLVDSPISEEDFENRIQGDACVQKFPYPGTSEQHETFCLSTLPFDFMALSRSDGEVTCKWTVASSCKDIQYQQIYDKCYHVGVCGKHDMKKAKPISPDEVRWISILYGDHYQVLHMEKSRAFNDKQKSGFFEGGVMWKDNNGEAATDAMVLTRMAAFGLYPGDFVKTSDPMVNTLCSARADAIGSVSSIVTEAAVATNTQLPSIGTVNTQMNTYGTGYAHTTVIIPSGYAFPTRNVYRARLNKQKTAVDLNYFHGICGKLCHGCYAATYESFETHKDKMPNGRFWVPAGRNKPSDTQYKTNMKDSKCAKVDQSKKKSFHVLINIVKDGNSLTYVDAPLFDYQPIMCISGAPVPATKATGAYYANSELRGETCQCKSGFADALNTPLAPELKQMGYSEGGTICVSETRCETVNEEDTDNNAVILFLDGSCGVDKADFPYLKNFVTDVGPSLPKSKPFWIFLYAHVNKGDGGEVYYREPRKILKFPGNWNIATYNREVAALGWHDVGCYTATFYNFNELIRTTKHISGKKLVIWVSQQTQDRDEWNIKQQLIDNDYHVIGVGVRSMGPEYHYLIPDSQNKILIDVNSVHQFPRKVVSIVNKKICDPYP